MEPSVRRIGDFTELLGKRALCRVGGMAAAVNTRGQLASTSGCARLRLATIWWVVPLAKYISNTAVPYDRVFGAVIRDYILSKAE
jgi:hypothetical protein